MVAQHDGPLVYIDDDDDDRFLFDEAIRGLGFSNQIHYFASGQEALTYLKSTQEQPLLILCDLNMPVMDGLELRRVIDQSAYLKEKSIPFIYFTTAASPDQVKAAYEGDIQGFHVKAHEFDGLQKQLRLIIEYWQACLHPNSFYRSVRG